MRSCNLFLSLLLIATGASAAGISTGGTGGGTGTGGAGGSSAGPTTGTSAAAPTNACMTLTGVAPAPTAAGTSATGGAGTTSGINDTSGIFLTPGAVNATNSAGDAAPRTEPAAVPDQFNTAPRVPAPPQNPSGPFNGGAGATAGDTTAGVPTFVSPTNQLPNGVPTFVSPTDQTPNAAVGRSADQMPSGR